MTDRETQLENIRLSPLDDTARLVYADWLDEFGSGDLDVATAKFIRVSCSRGNRLMPKAAYAWIHEHWKRLIPQALKAHPKFRVQKKQGRVIFLDWARGIARRHAVRLHYCRGFIQRVDSWSWVLESWNGPIPAVKLDQPLTGLHISEQTARRDAHIQAVNAERERRSPLESIGEGE